VRRRGPHIFCTIGSQMAVRLSALRADCPVPPGSSLLRNYATSREAGGLIPDEITGFFLNLPNTSIRTMSLGPPQPLTEVSTRNLVSFVIYVPF
jgi:hypothetical protein